MQLSKIVVDESLYPRSGVSEINVHRLVSALKTGARLPPVVIEKKTCRLVDGRHRYEAYTRLKRPSVDVIEKAYRSEAELFADAVRLNVGHGEPLDHYNVRSAVIRLTEYGFAKEAISEVVRLPLEQIVKIERGYVASDASTGRPVALKGGLSHLAGSKLDKEQLEVNRHFSGGKVIFYVRQLIGLVQHDMVPESESFEQEMDALVKAWLERRKKSTAA
jgi:hypothetical protein